MSSSSMARESIGGVLTHRAVFARCISFGRTYFNSVSALAEWIAPVSTGRCGSTRRVTLGVNMGYFADQTLCRMD
jgi:hypothetical protein